MDSLSVEISATSATVLAGDFLLGDTVTFDAEVRDKNDNPVQTAGRQFQSLTSAVSIDATTGVAVLEETGEARVAVTFTQPLVPGPDPLGDDSVFTVLDFRVLVSVSSVSSGFLPGNPPPGDTLASDSVIFTASVLKGTDNVPVADPTFTSGKPAVVNILDASTGRAVLAGFGQDTVRVTFTNPEVPRKSGQLVVPVGTFVVDVTGNTSPTMGDTVPSYTATVTDTRTGQVVTNTSGQVFSSSDVSVARVLDPGTGRTFVRDIGQADILVEFAEPRLPHDTVRGSLTIDVTEERFYGAFSDTTGTFGLTAAGDTVIVSASEVHFFTANTRVEFPNGTIGFVDSVAADLLRFFVPAGADTGQLVLRNLVDDNAQPRDGVPTRIVFNGPGSAVVDDLFEPNDTFPLTAGLEITQFPFEALLSWDPRKSAPADTNFLYFVLNAATTFDFMAEWQQDADLNFKLCSGDSPPPPADYARDAGMNPICQFFAESLDRTQEIQSGETLSAGIYVIAYYCVDCPATLPLTYRVRIE